MGKKLTLLGKSGVSAPTKHLESFKRPDDTWQVAMISDEVTSLCPVTGQPDQYVVEITYTPEKLCIESKSLKLKLQSYRQQGMFVEELCSTICKHVVESIDPVDVKVLITQKSRGGVSIKATAMQARIPTIAGVYVITNHASRKVYVGGTVNLKERWYAHRYDLSKGKHANKHLQRAWDKYGEGVFTFKVLELCEIYRIEQVELFWMEKLRATDESRGYNTCLIPGSTRGIRWSHSEEAKLKIGAALRGRRRGLYTAEHRAKISKSLMGKRLSPESIEKGAAKRRGQKRGPYSAEHRKKIGDAHRGKKRGPQSAEHLAKRVAAMKRIRESRHEFRGDR